MACTVAQNECHCVKIELVILTTVRTAPGFCTLRALTTWNTSTTPSVLHLSMVVAMAQNIPDLLTVSLQKKTHTGYSDLTQTALSTPPYPPLNSDLRTLPSVWSHLQWISMGWLPVLLWILDISPMASTMLVRLEQRPSGAQLVMCSCITWWALPSWREGGND